MGKTTDLFKKIRDTKGRFHAKMGSIKDRNGMDLTKAEDIKRYQKILKGGKNTQKNCTKKDLLYMKIFFMTQIIMVDDHSPRARHPGMRNQVGKNHYKENQWR